MSTCTKEQNHVVILIVMVTYLIPIHDQNEDGSEVDLWGGRCPRAVNRSWWPRRAGWQRCLAGGTNFKQWMAKCRALLRLPTHKGEEYEQTVFPQHNVRLFGTAAVSPWSTPALQAAVAALGLSLHGPHIISTSATPPSRESAGHRQDGQGICVRVDHGRRSSRRNKVQQGAWDCTHWYMFREGWIFLATNLQRVLFRSGVWLMILIINIPLNLQLFIVNTVNNSIIDIPRLKLESSECTSTSCGIHTISTSDERDYLATGGDNPTRLAIYGLPEMQPLAIGEVSVVPHFHSLKWLSVLDVWCYCRDTQTGSLTSSGSLIPS